MDHFIFSRTLTFVNPDKKLEIKDLNITEIAKIRSNSGTDVYLCGGGVFAGWFLEMN